MRTAASKHLPRDPMRRHDSKSKSSSKEHSEARFHRRKISHAATWNHCNGTHPSRWLIPIELPLHPVYQSTPKPRQMQMKPSRCTNLCYLEQAPIKCYRVVQPSPNCCLLHCLLSSWPSLQHLQWNVSQYVYKDWFIHVTNAAMICNQLLETSAES